MWRVYCVFEGLVEATNRWKFVLKVCLDNACAVQTGFVKHISALPALRFRSERRIDYLIYFLVAIYVAPCVATRANKVVVWPADTLKELLENSLDAGSTHINVNAKAWKQIGNRQ